MSRTITQEELDRRIRYILVEQDRYILGGIAFDRYSSPRRGILVSLCTRQLNGSDPWPDQWLLPEEWGSWIRGDNDVGKVDERPALESTIADRLAEDGF